MMIDYWDYFNFGYDAPTPGSGMATTLPYETERDYGAELRAAVEEATGQSVPAPEKQRIGFL